MNDGQELGVISYPDKLDSSCDFVNNGFYLNGKYCHLGLPNFIESYFRCDTCKIEFAGIIEIANNSFEVYPNPFNTELNIVLPYVFNIISVRLFDATGRLFSINCNISKLNNKNLLKISRGNLPSGVKADPVDQLRPI